MALQTGDPAPEILAKDQSGNDVKLSDFKGKKVILYFYQKTIPQGVRLRLVTFVIIMTHF